MERKTALVTGAGRGIGAQTAKLFAQNGYTVAIHCNTSTQQAQTVVRNILSQNGRAAVFQADIQDAQQVNAMVRCIEEKFGAIDVLVNNAGIAQQKLFTDITDQDWQTMIATNLTGVFYCCRVDAAQAHRFHCKRFLHVGSHGSQLRGPLQCGKGRRNCAYKSACKRSGPKRRSRKLRGARRDSNRYACRP